MKQSRGQTRNNSDYIEINELQALIVNGDEFKVVDGDMTDDLAQSFSE